MAIYPRRGKRRYQKPVLRRYGPRAWDKRSDPSPMLSNMSFYYSHFLTPSEDNMLSFLLRSPNTFYAHLHTSDLSNLSIFLCRGLQNETRLTSFPRQQTPSMGKVSRTQDWNILTALLVNYVLYVCLFTVKKPCRNAPNSDVDNGGAEPNDVRVGIFRPPRRFVRATVVHIGISRSFFYSVGTYVIPGFQLGREFIDALYMQMQWYIFDNNFQ